MNKNDNHIVTLQSPASFHVTVHYHPVSVLWLLSLGKTFWSIAITTGVKRKRQSRPNCYVCIKYCRHEISPFPKFYDPPSGIVLKIMREGRSRYVKKLD